MSDLVNPDAPQPVYSPPPITPIESNGKNKEKEKSTLSKSSIELESSHHDASIPRLAAPYIMASDYTQFLALQKESEASQELKIRVATETQMHQIIADALDKWGRNVEEENKRGKEAAIKRTEERRAFDPLVNSSLLNNPRFREMHYLSTQDQAELFHKIHLASSGVPGFYFIHSPKTDSHRDRVSPTAADKERVVSFPDSRSESTHSLRMVALITGKDKAIGIPVIDLIGRSEVSLTPSIDSHSQPHIHPANVEEFTLTINLFVTALQRDAMKETIEKAAQVKERPQELDFARQFAEKTLKTVNHLNQKEGESLLSSQRNLLLLTVAMGLLYKTEHGGMSGEEVMKMKEGELYQRLQGAFYRELNKIGDPDKKVEILTNLISYLDRNPSTKELTAPLEAFNEAFVSQPERIEDKPV